MSKSYFKTATKSIVSLGLITSSIFSLCSCGKKTISWSGVGETYERNYAKYDSPTVKSNELYEKYTKCGKLSTMVCQDLIYNMNYLCKLFDTSLVTTYKVSFISHHDDRLSYKIKMFGENSNLLLDISVKDLSYCSYYISETNTPLLMLSNGRYFEGSYYLNKEFWLDTYFDITFFTYTEDGQIDLNYDFSWRNFDEEERQSFQDFYAEWFIISPYYFEGTQVEVAE